MKHTTSCFLYPGLALLLAGVGTWAQGGTTTVTPLSTYTVPVAYEEQQGLSPTVTSPITDQATLSALWANMAIPVPVPTVDFTKHLVVVSTAKERTVPESLTLDAKGNLTVAEMNVSLDADYVISVISNAGITSVNGAALPTVSLPVTILRQASAGTSSFTTRLFTTITTAEAWKVLWGNATAPVTVDFTKEEALFVALGQMNGDTTIAITGVNETAQRLTATVVETSLPPPETNPIIRPYTVAVIPKSDKLVYFADSAVGGTMLPIISTITVANSLQQTPDTAVIKDVAAWKELYDKQMPAGTALPEVNFGDNMALVVFAGQTRTTQTVLISMVKEANGELTVEYSITPIRTAVGIGRAYPCTAVIVPKSDLPVTFTKAAATGPTLPRGPVIH